jgi:hypothetical protein
VRQRRVAQLAPQAAAGDLSAMRTLAFALIAAPMPEQRDLPRVLALLEGAAAGGDVQAQVMLGDMLATGRLFLTSYEPVTPGLQDAARGIAWLKRAASQACRVTMVEDPEASTYTYNGFGSTSPSFAVSRYLEREGKPDQALLWNARSILHCNQNASPTVPYGNALQELAPARRRTLLAMQLLRRDRANIARAKAGMTPDDIAAAEEEAADLRRRVAASEREYPAPKHKELP